VSNGWEINSALAVSFDFTGHTFTFSLGSGGGPYTATLATGTRRVWLAPASSELAQLTCDAMNTAVGSAMFSPSLSEDGYIAITATGNTWKTTTLHSTSAGKILGFENTLSAFAATHTATLHPRYLFLSVSALDGVWQARQDGAAEETSGGQVYSFGGASLGYKRSVRLEFIPWDPTVAASVQSPATPYQPDAAYLAAVGDTGTVRAWSMLDVLWWARNADCALTLGDFQALRTSTSVRYFLGRVATVLSPKMERHDPRLPRYLKHEMGFVLPNASNTATRA
jgi:hypothetical protein